MGVLDKFIEAERRAQAEEEARRAAGPPTVPFSVTFTRAVSEFLERVPLPPAPPRGLLRRKLPTPQFVFGVVAHDGDSVRQRVVFELDSSGTSSGDAVVGPGQWRKGFSTQIGDARAWGRVDDGSLEAMIIRLMAKRLA